MLRNILPELRALDLSGVVHEASKVVGNALGADGTIHALDDEISGLSPAEVAQQHLATEQQVDPLASADEARLAQRVPDVLYETKKASNEG